jgi:hypothetical protein
MLFFIKQAFFSFMVFLLYCGLTFIWWKLFVYIREIIFYSQMAANFLVISFFNIGSRWLGMPSIHHIHGLVGTSISTNYKWCCQKWVGHDTWEWQSLNPWNNFEIDSWLDGEIFIRIRYSLATAADNIATFDRDLLWSMTSDRQDARAYVQY